MKILDEQLFIAYFPYLFMRDVEEINLGFINIWNFEKKKNVYIKDDVLRDKVEKLLGIYKLSNNEIKDIGIISIDATNFRVFSDNEIEKAKIARLIIFLCSASKNNTGKINANSGHGMVTADNFDLIFHKFNLNDDYINETVGSVVTFRIGGYTVSETNIEKPSFVPSPMRFSLDEKLLEALLELQSKNPRVFSRILNATEVFAESYFNSHHSSQKARILLQSSAFEIFFRFPRNGKKKYFIRKIEEFTKLSCESKYKNYYKNTKGETIEEMRTMKGIWAQKFYELRSGIIHGDSIDKFLFKGQRHLDIALLFFIICIKKRAEKYISSYDCDSEIKWEKWKDELTYPKPTIKTEFVMDYFPRKLLMKLLHKDRPC